MEEDADESALGMALLRTSGLAASLQEEAAALEVEFGKRTAIAVASIKTARKGLKRAGR